MNKERTLRIASDETNKCSSVLIIPVTIYLPFCQVIMEPVTVQVQRKCYYLINCLFTLSNNL